MVKSIEDIASVCHAANSAYCQTLGDDCQRPWGEAPESQKESVRHGVRFYLRALADGREPTGKDAHDAWKAFKIARAWKYGPEKDEAAKTHPCLVDYDELPAEQKFKDYLFIGIVKAFWERGLG